MEYEYPKLIQNEIISKYMAIVQTTRESLKRRARLNRNRNRIYTKSLVNNSPRNSSISSRKNSIQSKKSNKYLNVDTISPNIPPKIRLIKTNIVDDFPIKKNLHGIYTGAYSGMMDDNDSNSSKNEINKKEKSCFINLKKIFNLIDKIVINLNKELSLEDKVRIISKDWYIAIQSIKELPYDTTHIQLKSGILLGNIFLEFSDFKNALCYFKISKKYAKRYYYFEERMILFDKMTICLRKLNFHSKALIYQKKKLEIARELEDDSEEMNALDNLGLQSYYIGDIDKAIFYHTKMMKGNFGTHNNQNTTKVRGFKKCKHLKNVALISGIFNEFDVFQSKFEVILPHKTEGMKIMISKLANEKINLSDFSTEKINRNKLSELNKTEVLKVPKENKKYLISLRNNNNDIKVEKRFYNLSIKNKQVYQQYQMLFNGSENKKEFNNIEDELKFRISKQFILRMNNKNDGRTTNKLCPIGNYYTHLSFIRNSKESSNIKGNYLGVLIKQFLDFKENLKQFYK